MRDQFTSFTRMFPDDAASAIATASTTLADGLEKNGERVFDAVIDANRRIVEFAVTASDRVTDRLADVLPERFPVELPFSDRLPSFSGTVPTAAVTGERYLDFVERAVNVNRDFNERIVSMLKGDVAVAVERVTATAATKPVAKKPAAKKPAVKKPAAKRTATAKPVAKRTATKRAPAKKAPARTSPT